MISVRKAEAQDEHDVWVWRNDPATRRASRETARVPRATGRKWFADSLENSRRLMLIVEDGRGKLGVVRFDEIGAAAFEISINLNPQWRGRGLCRPTLENSIDSLRASREVRRLVAAIRDDNEGSKRCFISLGFVLKGREGDFGRYELALPQS